MEHDDPSPPRGTGTGMGTGMGTGTHEPYVLRTTRVTGFYTPSPPPEMRATRFQQQPAEKVEDYQLRYVQEGGYNPGRTTL